MFKKPRLDLTLFLRGAIFSRFSVVCAASCAGQSRIKNGLEKIFTERETCVYATVCHKYERCRFCFVLQGPSLLSLVKKDALAGGKADRKEDRMLDKKIPYGIQS